MAGSDATKVSNVPTERALGETADAFDQSQLHKDASIRIFGDGRDAQSTEFEGVKFPSAHQTMEAAPFRVGQHQSPDASAYGFQIGAGLTQIQKNHKMHQSTIGGRLRGMMSDTLHSSEQFNSQGRSMQKTALIAGGYSSA